MALDSATRRLLEQFAEFTPDEAGAFELKFAELNGPAPAMDRVEEHTIEGPYGQATLRVLVPIQTPEGSWSTTTEVDGFQVRSTCVTQSHASLRSGHPALSSWWDTVLLQSIVTQRPWTTPMRPWNGSGST